MANSFIKNTKSELKKVVWPTKKQLINNTVMVLFLILAFAAIVLTFDMVLKFLDTQIWNVITNRIIK